MACSDQPSVVILAARGDAGAVAVATLLRRRGLGVSLVDGGVLARGLVRHRPDSGSVPGGAWTRGNSTSDDASLSGARPGAGPLAGSGSSTGSSALTDVVHLAGGVRIDASTDAVLCRLPVLDAPRFADPVDGEYASSEMFALALSWLHGLGDAVVNRPSPRGLAGDGPDLLGLHGLAASVGLRAVAVRLHSNGAALPWGSEEGVAGGAGNARPAEKRAGDLPRHVPGGIPEGSWQRWDGAFVPVTGLSGAVPAAGAASFHVVGTAPAPGPPLPMPTVTLEPTRPLTPALVCGDVVVGAPAGLERATVELVRAAGLCVAEVAFGVTAPVSSRVEGCDGDHRDNLPHRATDPTGIAEVVVLGVDPVPGLRTPAQVEALAVHLERRAQARRVTPPGGAAPAGSTSAAEDIPEHVPAEAPGGSAIATSRAGVAR